MPGSPGPIAVYEKACARCHGPNGSFYGPELGKGKTDPQLKKAIQDMADNQGQIDLTPEQVEEQTAYHRAIIRNEPFLAITKQTKTELEGESMAKASVSVTVNGNPVPVTRSGFTWQARLLEEGPILVTARLGKASVSLDPSKETHSHSQPLPDPPKKPADSEGGILSVKANRLRLRREALPCTARFFRVGTISVDRMFPRRAGGG